MRVDNMIIYGANSYSAAAGAATSALPSPYVTPGSAGDTLMVQNVGSNIAYARFGDASVTPATTNDCALLPGAVYTFSRGTGDPYAEPQASPTKGFTHVSLISALGTTINIVIGEGT